AATRAKPGKASPAAACEFHACAILDFPGQPRKRQSDKRKVIELDGPQPIPATELSVSVARRGAMPWRPFGYRSGTIPTSLFSSASLAGHNSAKVRLTLSPVQATIAAPAALAGSDSRN